MRYGSYANEDGQPEQEWHATVQNVSAIESQRLAIRHARAMAAVLRAAKAEAKAMAYASAVADVVAMLEEQMRGLELMPRAKVVLRYVRSLLNRLHTGAHVGAAKKGVPNG